MKQVLVCKNCDALLSAPVEIIDSAIIQSAIDTMYDKLGYLKGNIELNDVILCFRDGLPITQRGFALKQHNKLNAVKDGPIDFSPQFWIRLDDMTEKSNYNEHAQYGCCGYGIGTRPNRSCVCGEEVGFEESDCYTWHSFIPAPGKIKWQNVKS